MNDNDVSTKPTLETILGRINDLRRKNVEFRKSMETRLDGFGQRLDGFEYLMDNIEKQFSLSRADVLDVKMELRELRNQLKEHFPALK